MSDFKVRASVVAVTRGPSVTRFELEPAPGVKVSSVVNLADDIALKLAAPGVRIEAPIPGKAAIGIEVPTEERYGIFKEVVDCEPLKILPANWLLVWARISAGTLLLPI